MNSIHPLSDLRHRILTTKPHLELARLAHLFATSAQASNASFERAQPASTHAPFKARSTPSSLSGCSASRLRPPSYPAHSISAPLTRLVAQQEYKRTASSSSSSVLHHTNSHSTPSPPHSLVTLTRHGGRGGRGGGAAYTDTICLHHFVPQALGIGVREPATASRDFATI